MMNRLTAIAALMLPLTLGACASLGLAPERSAGGDLFSAAGVTGSVLVTETRDGLSVRLTAAGLAPGQYGVHLHAVGRCEAPGFQSAGGHWNPGAHQHGRLNPAGAHAGDLGNLVIAANGRGNLQALVAQPFDGAQGLLDADGASLVIHAAADDERTDPAGNAGARIACAVIVAR